MKTELEAMQDMINKLPKQTVSFRTPARYKVMLDLKAKEQNTGLAEVITEALQLYFNPDTSNKELIQANKERDHYKSKYDNVIKEGNHRLTDLNTKLETARGRVYNLEIELEKVKEKYLKDKNYVDEMGTYNKKLLKEVKDLKEINLILNKILEDNDLGNEYSKYAR